MNLSASPSSNVRHSLGSRASSCSARTALAFSILLQLVSPALAQEDTSGSTAGGGYTTENAPVKTNDPFGPPPAAANPAAWEDVNRYLNPADRPSYDGSSQGFEDRSSGGARVLTGNQSNSGAYASGSISLGDDQGRSIRGGKKAVPEFHMVKKGDTLWAVSSEYYGSPWEWPRLWSMNPQVENPHWIYPGDQLRTGAAAAASSSDDNSAGKGGFIGRSRTVPPGTIFLRDVGYIGDPERDTWGELVGAREDMMMLGRGNVVYLQLDDDVEPRIGQRLSVFAPVRTPTNAPGARKPPGELVKVYGTVRIDAWDHDTRVARGMLIESVDVVERGAKVGPVGRRFDVVPPKQATTNLEAVVLTGLYPHIYFGGNQVVFIDKGKEDGLVPGNRLRVVRHGDMWRRNLRTGSRFSRMRAPLDSGEDAPQELTPLHADDEDFPDEVIAEVMILRTEDYSATCLVVESSRELVPGDKMVAVAGY